MDPTECLRLLRAAEAARDWPAAFEHADNLITWLYRGGFPPEPWDRPTALQYAQEVRRVALARGGGR